MQRNTRTVLENNCHISAPRKTHQFSSTVTAPSGRKRERAMDLHSREDTAYLGRSKQKGAGWREEKKCSLQVDSYANIQVHEKALSGWKWVDRHVKEMKQSFFSPFLKNKTGERQINHFDVCYCAALCCTYDSFHETTHATLTCRQKNSIEGERGRIMRLWG